MVDMVALQKNLNRAKVEIMRKPDSAFFASVLFSMKFVWDDSQPTAYTNGLTIGVNPEFFQRLSVEERVGVLVHEACHPAFMHLDRLKGRVHWLFNEAADHVINLMLLSRGFKLPSFALADRRFKDMGTEEVYDILLKEHIEFPAPERENPMSDLRPPPNGMTDGEMKQKVDDMLVCAMVYSKMQGDKPGTVPGDIERYLDQLLDPKLPWQAILRKWLKALAKTDYSWTRPSKRYLPKYYLPTLKSEGAMIDFQAFVDVSGSETQEDFTRFISELHGILRMMKPKHIWLGQFDTEIKSMVKVKSVRDLANVEFTGWGGTVITDVLDHAEKTQPKVCMIFTDGGFHMDRETCKANILWMIHDNPEWTAPFGKVIHFNSKENSDEY